ncbi:MAG: SCP2 sterol-binding domain-containing protein [Deltaproteobacteria bacterium]|nr:SCP2 sterol-binding domain-containing protein [Deltaproteobacteria bacterium]
MKYWKDHDEPIKAFVRLMEESFKDAELSASLQSVNQLIWFDYTQDAPDCSFWVNVRPGKLEVGKGKPDGTPDLIMSTSADNAHLSWSNKLSPIMAITRKIIIVKGSATGLLKLAPKLSKVAKIYEQVLKELGWEDKIVQQS